MMQTDLFDPPRARGTDPATSHAAAAAVPEFAAGHYGRILLALQDHGPATVAELAARLGMGEQQVNKRLPELERAGAVSVLAGVTRPGASGRRQRVWARNG